ncbi:MAG: hypothetical protein JXO44_12425 [Clostridia bacterium]|nr:hypothetical protein [Clostridia bacterium]
MILEIDYRIKQLEIEALLTCYHLEEVRGYCGHCSNYGKNYTCPEFDFTTEDYLKDYHYVTIIRTRIPSDRIKANLQTLKQMDFPSTVFDRYEGEYKDDCDKWHKKLSMFIYEQAKDIMTERLNNMEATFEGGLGLVPGCCTACKVCSKVLGKACHKEGALRYSLEALGFLVSDVYKLAFDETLQWTEDLLPESFGTCSAFLSKSLLDIELLQAELKGMVIQIG